MPPDDFHARMTDIALRQGREPIDGTKIEGFGPADPPVPRVADPEIPSAAESYGEPLEAPQVEIPPPVPSPLIEMGLGRVVLPPPVVTIGRNIFDVAAQLPGGPAKEPELWIRDEEATYKGRRVTLLAGEMQALARIVVRALKRDLAQLEVGGQRVRRRSSAGTKARKGASAPTPSTETNAVSTAPPARPRKPRGSLLNRQGPMKP